MVSRVASVLWPESPPPSGKPQNADPDFWAWGLGFRGLGVWGLEVWDFEFRVQGVEFWVSPTYCRAP